MPPNQETHPVLTIVALLTIRDAEKFDRFEKQAVAIMSDHGGRLDSAFRPNHSGQNQSPSVDEIHILKFPDPGAFDCYRTDPRLKELAALRDEAISHTTVYTGDKEIDYR